MGYAGRLIDFPIGALVDDRLGTLGLARPVLSLPPRPGGGPISGEGTGPPPVIGPRSSA